MYIKSYSTHTRAAHSSNRLLTGQKPRQALALLQLVTLQWQTHATHGWGVFCFYFSKINTL